MANFYFSAGSLPILISMPHNGTRIPESMAARMQPYALQSVDTDWYLHQLYDFATEMGCWLINPYYSRYVIDLNRPEDNRSLYPGSDTTELCPTTQFDYRPIYLEGCEPTGDEISQRIAAFWRPYHQQLQRALAQIREKFGYALLFEAHSIKSRVPRFFDGQLADFNFGNFDEKSSSRFLSDCIESNWQDCNKDSSYSQTFNGRFKGGYITRHYGDPEGRIESLQLELSQATYMNESNLEYDERKAAGVKRVLRSLFAKLEQYSQRQIGS